MSELLREIEEDLKKEKVQRIVRLYAPFVLGGVLLLILGLIGRQAFVSWQESQAEAAAEQWFTALQRYEVGQTDSAIAAIRQLTEDGYAGNRTLALLTAAHWTRSTAPAESVKFLQQVTKKDGSHDTALQSLARLRLAELQAADDAWLIEEAKPGRPFAAIAQLRLALYRLEQGNQEEAATLLSRVAEDAGSSDTLRQQARQLLSALTPPQSSAKDAARAAP